MKILKYILIIPSVIIGFLICLLFQKPINTEEVNLGADCPVCPSCVISAEKIIKDNPNIDLTEYHSGSTYILPNEDGLVIKIKDTAIEEVYNKGSEIISNIEESKFINE